MNNSKHKAYTIDLIDKDGYISFEKDSMVEVRECLMDYLVDKDDVFGFEIKVLVNKLF